MSQVYLVIRRSFDFYHSLKIGFHKDAAVMPEHVEGINRALQYWQDTLGCSWAVTRKHIASIVLKHNLSCLPDGVILHSDNLQLPTSGWIIPIDDDDLLDVRVITKIRNIEPSALTLHWPVNTLTIDKVGATQEFTANSYALSSNIASTDNGYCILQRHVYAGSNSEYRVISDKPLGLKLTHPASMGILKNLRHREDCLDAINKFKKCRYDGIYQTVVNEIKACFTI